MTDAYESTHHETSSIPPLDPVPLIRLRQLGGEDLAQKMITLFLDQTPPRLADAAGALRQGDLVALGKVVHSLKSSAGQLGARRMQELSGLLEVACDAGQKAQSLALFPALEMAWEETRLHLLAQLK